MKIQIINNSIAVSIKNKIISYENIYRYETARYNNVISNINNEINKNFETI